MSNHFHILVEVPQRPEGGLSNEVLVSLVRECLGEQEGNGLERMISSINRGQSNCIILAVGGMVSLKASLKLLHCLMYPSLLLFFCSSV